MTSEPKLTKDLTKARNNLDEFGYCLIAEALTTKELETARERLKEQAAEEERRGLSFRDGGPEQKLVDDFGEVRPDAFSTSSNSPTFSNALVTLSLAISDSPPFS